MWEQVCARVGVWVWVWCEATVRPTVKASAFEREDTPAPSCGH